ncbi:PF11185 family protein [Leptospira weilii serovar Ranarum str. ICFT]|uniref:PF11185 family protein n=2 Tax=Leptospira weilii TaxID=28184 RepID=N1WLE9_9LEPT|nr:PF11185 family protein [Leptospira weilii serovar Ranarum str. ICFT]
MIEFEHPIIFKYVSGEDHHIESIKDNYFYLSRLWQVNDPEDCTINPTIDLANTTYQEIENFLLRNSPSGDHSSLKQYALKLFNDKGAQREYIKELEKINIALDEEYKKSFKILCLTDNYRSKHMWKNYAKKKKKLDGFCLGYKCESKSSVSFVREHKKYKIRIKLGSIEVKGNPQDSLLAYEVFYGDEDLIAYNPFKNNVNILLSSYLYKKEKWSSEKEFRTLITDDQTIKPDLQKIRYIEEDLKYIIFGENHSIKDRNAVLKAIHENGRYGNIKFYEASLIFCKLRFKEIKHFA